jgi:Ca-activated chloride channel family protein
VKVYTIGIGLRGMAPMPVGRDPFTGQVVTRPMPADVDEDTLQKIADKTGGKYYRADSADTMRRIYAEIDSLEKTDVEVKKFEHFDELYRPVGLGGLSLLLLEIILSQTVWRKLP